MKIILLIIGISFLVSNNDVRSQSLKVDTIRTSVNLMDLIDTDHKPYYLKNAKPFLLPNSTGPLPSLLLPNSFGDEPALFCKIERNIETKSKLAPRFRLGSVNYTNWMEGKGEFYDRYRP